MSSTVMRTTSARAVRAKERAITTANKERFIPLFCAPRLRWGYAATEFDACEDATFPRLHLTFSAAVLRRRSFRADYGHRRNETRPAECDGSDRLRHRLHGSRSGRLLGDLIRIPQSTTRGAAARAESRQAVALETRLAERHDHESGIGAGHFHDRLR